MLGLNKLSISSSNLNLLIKNQKYDFTKEDYITKDLNGILEILEEKLEKVQKYLILKNYWVPKSTVNFRKMLEK